MQRRDDRRPPTRRASRHERLETHSRPPQPAAGARPPVSRMTSFPSHWNHWADELIPSLVKFRFSPKESWKTKPFSKEDARFFLKGIQELSDLFTQERPRDLPAYFRHPRFRSAYLLYFLPLQAAKFVLLFQRHAKAIEAALAHAKKTGTLRIADLGAGPGTASFALLLVLLDKWKSDPTNVPLVELTWLDTNSQSMDDGRLLLTYFQEAHPELKDRVKLRTETAPWWKAPQILDGNVSLILMGNVLNEAPADLQRRSGRQEPEESFEGDTHPQPTVPSEWKELLRIAKGGGILIVDPAARRSSQGLSRLRDLLLTEHKTEKPMNLLIWGPCLHMGACPMAYGRDWCHFSFPTRVPGKWFRDFSLGLGSERQWLKFSYLWLASSEHPAPAPERDLRLVISDPLGGAKQDVLLCEPGRIPRKFRSSKNKDVHRGDVIRMPAKKQD